MFSNFLNKKDVVKENKEEVQKEAKKVEEPKKSVTPELQIQPEIKVDNETQQCIDMGFDIKDDVRKASFAFFNSKNKDKMQAYLKFEEYLSSLSIDKIQSLQRMKYLAFKTDEEKITTSLKNGFGQFLSKGASLDEETRKIIEFVFGDIKKFPSKGHRYWYFKTFMWQKREGN